MILTIRSFIRVGDSRVNNHGRKKSLQIMDTQDGSKLEGGYIFITHILGSLSLSAADMENKQSGEPFGLRSRGGHSQLVLYRNWWIGGRLAVD